MQRYSIALIVFVALVFTPSARSAPAACTPTGFAGLSAVLVNPGDVIGGNVNATGCDIGIYYSGTDAKVQNTAVYGALHYGVMVHGDTTTTNVDVLNSNIHTIGDSPLNGNQRGVGIYYRAFLSTGSATGRVSGNHLSGYQKGGIVVNGPGSNVQVQQNEVHGQGPVGYIAQNGIQFGYGSSGSAMKNIVSGHAYTGSSTVSGGIVVVGGAGYGTCPDGNPCSYTTGIQIVQNTLTGNDIGIFLTNLRADFGPPDDATNIKAVNNTISNPALTNNYVYQAGVSDVGNNDKIINNTISGAGYSSSSYPGLAFSVDADVSFTNRPKVHANK
jgi:hypothetical protein